MDGSRSCVETPDGEERKRPGEVRDAFGTNRGGRNLAACSRGARAANSERRQMETPGVHHVCVGGRGRDIICLRRLGAIGVEWIAG